MDWELVYLSVFQCEENSSGEKEARELFSTASLDENQEELGEFLGELLKKLKGKKPSLSPAAGCKAYEFHQDILGQDDKKLCEQLLGAISLEVFRNHSSIIATKYARSPRSRSGLFFVLNANTTNKKSMSPGLFILQTDFHTGFLPESGNVTPHADVLIPELKNGMIYPYFDGMNYRFDQVVVTQKKQSDCFERVLRLNSKKDSIDIEEDSLFEILSEEGPGFEKYFCMPEDDRRSKRQVAGGTRLVQEFDLIEPERLSYLSKKTQALIVDQSKPAKLNLEIDDGLKFEGKIDQMGQNYFLARNGLEVVLVVRGSKFSTKGALCPADFLKLPKFKDVVSELQTSPCEDDE